MPLLRVIVNRQLCCWGSSGLRVCVGRRGKEGDATSQFSCGFHLSSPTPTRTVFFPSPAAVRKRRFTQGREGRRAGRQIAGYSWGAYSLSGTFSCCVLFFVARWWVCLVFLPSSAKTDTDTDVFHNFGTHFGFWVRTCLIVRAPSPPP